MSYSKYFSPQEVKIPVPISLGIVLLIILVLARAFSSTPLPSKASPTKIQNIQVVNPSASQFGVFWQTQKKETGWIVYGLSQTNLDKIQLDERDLQSKRGAYINHYVLLKGLIPNTTYYYKVISEDQLVSDVKGNAFSFTTPSNLILQSTLNPAYGKVIQTNGSGMENAIVRLGFNSSYPLVTLTKTTGEWLVPLHTIVNTQTLKTQTFNPDDAVQIDVFSENNISSKIQANIETLSPLPQTVILGEDYTMVNSDNVLSAESQTMTKSAPKIDILFPKEGASIPGGQPLIKGTAVVGKEVTIAIPEKKDLIFRSTPDKDGIWQVTLAQALAPGNYRLQVTTLDESDKRVQLTRRFTIIKSGEQVLGDATSEATPTLTQPTVGVTISPTVAVSPYPTTPLSTATPAPPVSGINILPLAAASISLVVVGLGILLAF